MSILSNILKNKLNVQEINTLNIPLAKLFLSELLSKGSKVILEKLSSADLLMIIKILKVELDIRESVKDFNTIKNAGIGVNYDSNSNDNGNANK